jgi:hypothetical protein
MTLPPAASAPARSYAQLLAALEAHRRTRDELLLHGMKQLRDPMNPPSDSWGQAPSPHLHS